MNDWKKDWKTELLTEHKKASINKQEEMVGLICAFILLIVLGIVIGFRLYCWTKYINTPLGDVPFYCISK
jgi:hypothetical protein